jgi:hypothetical protein
MTDYAGPHLRNNAAAVGVRSERGMTWLPALMIAAIVAMWCWR